MFRPFFDFNERFQWVDSLERQFDRALAVRAARTGGDSWMSMRDAGDELVLVVDAPGVLDKDLDITLENDVLTIRVEAKQSTPEGYRVVRSERPSVRLLKRIELPVRVDADAVVATLRDGVLELKLPKAAEARPKKIQINDGRTPALS